MHKQSVARAIAGKLLAIQNCQKSGNMEWEDKHREALRIIMDSAPSGSGIDQGVILDEGRSTSEKLVFQADFHHMNQNGYYDGWTEHQAIVRPSLVHGIDLRLTGRDRDGIKEYLGQVVYDWLTSEAP